MDLCCFNELKHNKTSLPLGPVVAWFWAMPKPFLYRTSCKRTKHMQWTYTIYIHGRCTWLYAKEICTSSLNMSEPSMYNICIHVVCIELCHCLVEFRSNMCGRRKCLQDSLGHLPNFVATLGWAVSEFIEFDNNANLGCERDNLVDTIIYIYIHTTDTSACKYTNYMHIYIYIYIYTRT